MRAGEFPNDLIQLTVHHAYAQLLHRAFMVFCSVSRGIIIKLLQMHFFHITSVLTNTEFSEWHPGLSCNLLSHFIFNQTNVFTEDTVKFEKHKTGEDYRQASKNLILKTSHPAYSKCFYQISCHLKNMLISSITGTSSNGECILK